MSEKKAIMHRLSNGLNVIIFSHGAIPKVSTQLWYRVGSRHEKSGERGLAHLLEHMTFKGTSKYAESEIDYITSYYAGHCNAFTSFDYTAYQFDFPSSAWEVSLDILAECMVGCHFKADLLDSERAAVIQELRMYQDDYESLLLEKMVEMIFAPHPYAYPIIGYKSDIWRMNITNLSDFYKAHYQPNNATLVIGGAVDLQATLKKATEVFEKIPSSSNDRYVVHEAIGAIDIDKQSVVLQREVSIPIGMIAWVVPGLSSRLGFSIDCLLWLLVADKGSLLYREFVEEKELVTELSGFSYDLFERGLLVIQYTPCDGIALDYINDQIRLYLNRLIAQGIDDELVARAYKKAQLAHSTSEESVARTVCAVAELYQATGDLNYAFHYNGSPLEVIQKDIQVLLQNYIKPERMHTGSVIPLVSSEKKRWASLMDKENTTDSVARKEHERNTELESKSAHMDLQDFTMPALVAPNYELLELSNGLRVLTCMQQDTSKIEIILKLKADNQYDPDGLEGLFYCTSQMILEGTHQFPGSALTDEFDKYGMHVGSIPGIISISCSQEDIFEALRLLRSLVTEAVFSKEAFERIIKCMHSDIDIFWDEPSEFIVDAARAMLYKGHPYGKLLLGSHETVNNITLEKLREFYATHYSPDEARIVIIGQFDKILVERYVQARFGDWHKNPVSDIKPSEITPVTSFTQVNYPIRRDQVALCFACPTVARMGQDYYTLLLFEQLFTGGFLGSLHSRLFTLRERSGLFYSINSSLAAYADLFPGMAYIMTLLSPDRLEEGIELLKECIRTASAGWNEKDLQIARNAVLSGIIDAFESQQGIIGMILFLDRFNLSHTYFQERIEELQTITMSDIKRVVEKYLRLERMILVTAGLSD